MDALTLECLVHDLGNVFQTLVEAAELLANDSRWAPVSATIMRSVEQGKGILTTLTSAQGPETVGLEDLVRTVVHFCRDFLSAARIDGVEFFTSIEPDLHIQCPEAALERVLVNLFLNAAQAMPKGGRVDVCARLRGDHVEITVTDQGPGVPEAILTEIFKPRFSTRAQRSGLGLHIVGSILRENNGAVSVANRADRTGAIFRISLPAAAKTEFATAAD